MERLKTSIPCGAKEVWETQSVLSKPVLFQGCTLTESRRPIIIIIFSHGASESCGILVDSH